MNISRIEQRVLHVLAQGGRIEFDRSPAGRVVDVTCYTRDGFGYPACTLDIFNKLKRKRLVQSRAGRPYHASRLGRERVRARPDNR